MKKTVQWYSSHSEQISFVLLVWWCLLPFGMVVFNLVMGALGKFPLQEDMVAQGFQAGVYVYNSALYFYASAFRVLGGITLFHAVLQVAFCWKSVKDRDTVRRMPWFYLLLCVLIWAIVATLVSDDPIKAFKGGHYLNDGLSSYFIYAGLFLTASTLSSEDKRKKILQVYSAVVSGLALIMLVQVYTNNTFLNYCFPAHHAVVFNQFNHFGYILCMGIMSLTGLYLYDAGAGRRTKVFYLAGLCLLVFALLINDTFGAYLASLVGTIIIYILYARSGRRLNAAVLLPALLFAVISALNYLGALPGSQSLVANTATLTRDIANIATGAEEAARAGTGRFTLWRDTIKRITERPIFGFGPEGFYGDNAITNSDRTHNEYLQMAGFLGIPALILYLAALVTLAAHHWKAIKRLSPVTLAVSGVTVGYLCSACFGNPVFNTAPFFWMFLGMTTVDGIDPPLLKLDVDETEARLYAGTDRRRAGALVGVGVVAVAALLGASMYLNVRTENANEQADLQCMRGAESVALLGVKNGWVEEHRGYWFDAGSYALVPDDEPMPSPYGMGTSRCGGGAKDFANEVGAAYEYDEGVDYRDKIIAVTVTRGDDGEVSVGMKWVKGEG